ALQRRAARAVAPIGAHDSARASDLGRARRFRFRLRDRRLAYAPVVIGFGIIAGLGRKTAQPHYRVGRWDHLLRGHTRRADAGWLRRPSAIDDSAAIANQLRLTLIAIGCDLLRHLAGRADTGLPRRRADGASTDADEARRRLGLGLFQSRW